ncbi:MAG: VCBS repeat-containing protein, partial [Planctomycetota bacterium]|nr:VCBS repeat-containing protein [Planctomycetota bacterium]
MKIIANSIFTAAVGLFLCAILSAQQPVVETTGLYGGATMQVRVSGDYPGKPAIVLAGRPTVATHNALLGLQLVSPIQVFRGQLNSSGLYEFSVSLPPVAWPGSRFAMQALVKNPTGKYQSSEVVGLLGESGQSALWQDATSTLPMSSAMSAAASVSPIDIDLDGDLDLVISDAGSIMSAGGILVYENDGNGAFTDVTSTAFTGINEPVFVAKFCDYDLDGDQDFVAGGGIDQFSFPYPTRLYSNDGTGVFTYEQDMVSTLSSANNFAWGDVDGDGYPELLLSEGGTLTPSGGTQSMALYRNIAGVFSLDSTFEAAAFNNTFPAGEQTTSVEFGDVDRDGDLDLFVSRTDNVDGALNMLLINDGSGNFSDEALTRLPQMNSGLGDKSSDSQFVDVNNDGYLDIIVANSHMTIAPDQSGDMLLNYGLADPGVFYDAPSLFPDVMHEHLGIRLGIETGDVDLDGDQDVIIHPHEFFGSGSFPFVGRPVLFLNQGGAQGGTIGNFAEDTNFWVLGPFTTFISYYGTLFDADGDLDLDCYVPNYGGIVDPSNLQDKLLIN